MGKKKTTSHKGYEDPKMEFINGITARLSWQPQTFEELEAFIEAHYPQVEFHFIAPELYDSLIDLVLYRLSEKIQLEVKSEKIKSHEVKERIDALVTLSFNDELVKPSESEK